MRWSASPILQSQTGQGMMSKVRRNTFNPFLKIEPLLSGYKIMPNVFVFSGHGDESPIEYEAREKVPEGITLVTFAECMRVTKGRDVTDVLLAMKELDTALLEEPVKNQDVLWKAFKGRHIHVHPPGSPLPPLFYFSRANHYIHDAKSEDQIENVHDGMVYYKSGVYKVPDFELPVQPEWKISEDGSQILHPESGLKLPLRGNESLKYAKLAKTKVSMTEPYFEINPEVAKSMYEGAVWPDPLTAAKHASASLVKEEDAVWIPIQRVFKALGPGVYYWPICRGESGTPEREAKAVQIRSKSAQKRRETHGRGRRRKHRKTRRHK